MKKLVVSFVLLFAVVLSANAMHPEKLITQLSQEPNVIIETIGEGDLSQAMGAVVEGLETMHVVALEDCSDEVRQRYASMFNELEDVDGYVTILRVKEDEEDVRIMLKKEVGTDNIEGIYIFVVDEDDIVAVKLLGNISQEGIDKLLDEHIKNN